MAEKTRNPTSDEAVSGTWTGSAGSRWQVVDDYPDAGGADELMHGTTAGNLTFGFAAFDVPAGATSIQVHVDYYDFKNGSQSCNMAGRLKVGASYFNSSTHNPGNGSGNRTQRTDTWTNNPATSSAWTVDQVNGSAASNNLVAFGWNSSDASPTITLSSIRLRVTYTPPPLEGARTETADAAQTQTVWVGRAGALAATADAAQSQSSGLVGVAQQAIGAAAGLDSDAEVVPGEVPGETYEVDAAFGVSASQDAGGALSVQGALELPAGADQDQSAAVGFAAALPLAASAEVEPSAVGTFGAGAALSASAAAQSGAAASFGAGLEFDAAATAGPATGLSAQAVKDIEALAQQLQGAAADLGGDIALSGTPALSWVGQIDGVAQTYDEALVLATAAGLAPLAHIDAGAAVSLEASGSVGAPASNAAQVAQALDALGTLIEQAQAEFGGELPLEISAALLFSSAGTSPREFQRPTHLVVLPPRTRVVRLPERVRFITLSDRSRIVRLPARERIVTLPFRLRTIQLGPNP